MTLSPSENYARTKLLNKYPKTKKFAEGFPFELDPFQIKACNALENGKGVLVAAPTGAGKTIVESLRCIWLLILAENVFIQHLLKLYQIRSFQN